MLAQRSEASHGSPGRLQRAHSSFCKALVRVGGIGHVWQAARLAQPAVGSVHHGAAPGACGGRRRWAGCILSFQSGVGSGQQGAPCCAALPPQRQLPTVVYGRPPAWRRLP